MASCDEDKMESVGTGKEKGEKGEEEVQSFSFAFFLKATISAVSTFSIFFVQPYLLKEVEPSQNSPWPSKQALQTE